MEDCEVPEENLLGGLGNGFNIAMKVCSRILLNQFLIA